MESIAKFIIAPGGIEKTARLLSFGCLGLAGSCKPGSLSQQKFGIFAKQLSSARCTFRLFLDLPVLLKTLRYGLGKHEKDPIIRMLDLIANLADQLFFPLEHIAWASDCGLIKIPSAKFWATSIGCWAVSLLSGILKCFRQISKLTLSERALHQQFKLTGNDISDQLNEIRFNKNLSLITIAKNLADLINAIHWLPANPYLWSGKLPMKYVGIFGVISTVLGILLAKYQAQPPKPKKAD
ncbi:DgyrCDS10524 [Dimorphilus gyrociliatus]|uniref:DgyrCDS10524 n=1 Tax=Dimorphilus gyrociliatus TaxID=2664684 RepID=A0A7I8W0L6_9ANNE|nr:DgyrCDS10524 [Dimorphilus gyrociliatus]